MTLSDLAAIGEAVGGLAVLITLGYLAYQSRQTAAIERTAGQRDLLGQCRSWIHLTIDQELASRGEEALDWTQIFTHLGPDDFAKN